MPLKYKKILFIRANPSAAWVGAVSPPVGIAYLIAALEKHACQCTTIDTALGYSPVKIYSRIRSFRPDVIGISMLTYKYREVYKLADEIKKHFPDIPIIVGGAHVSTLRQKVLESCLSFDYGFVREAEESVVEFCQGMSPDRIKGIIYRENGNVVFTGERNYIENIDSIDWPKHYAIDLNEYLSKEILILSSRGCPFSCIFCPVSLAIGKQLRVRSASNVVDEIEYWFKKGYRRFSILDDNFTFYKERTLAICDEIKKRGLKNIILRCGNGIRADKVDREILEKMKEAGFTYVSYGVESGSERVLKILKKGETIEQIENAIKTSTELGFDVTLFFVIGAPYETPEDIEESVRISMKYPVVDVRFYNLIPYPGTELYKWVEDNNCFVANPDDYLNNVSGLSTSPVFETPELPFHTRIRSMERLNKITKKVRKKAINRKLRGMGLVGILLYYLLRDIYVSNFFQSLIRQNKLTRRIMDIIYLKIRMEEKERA